MKKQSKITSGLIAMCMVATSILPSASASNVNPDSITGSGKANFIGTTTEQTRITNNIGECGGEWNSFFNWGRAYSGVWSWGEATYLYAKATVTADGQKSQTKTKSSTNSSDVIKTDKIYQTKKDGRTLTTYHTVRGYWGSSTSSDNYRNESYSVEWEF